MAKSELEETIKWKRVTIKSNQMKEIQWRMQEESPKTEANSPNISLQIAFLVYWNQCHLHHNM